MKCLADSKNIILVLDAYLVPGVSMTVMVIVLISVDDGWRDWCWWLCKKRSTKWSHIKTSSNAIYITVSLIFLSTLGAASSLTYTEEGCWRNVRNRNPTVFLCHKHLKGHVPFQRCFKHLHFWVQPSNGWGYPDVWHPSRIGQNGARASLLSTGGVLPSLSKSWWKQMLGGFENGWIACKLWPLEEDVSSFGE